MSDKTNQTHGNQYDVTIGGKPFLFNIDNQDIERFVNQMDPDNKTVTVNNFLVSTVDSAQRDEFVALIKDDVALMLKIFEQFSFLVTSDVEVIVKKR